MQYKTTIFGACAPYPRLIYWIVSSSLQGKKDDMSSKSGPYSSEYSLNITSTNYTLCDKCSVFCLVTISSKFSTVELSGHWSMFLIFFGFIYRITVYGKHLIFILNIYPLFPAETFCKFLVLHNCHHLLLHLQLLHHQFHCHKKIWSLLLSPNLLLISTSLLAVKLAGHAYCMHSEHSQVSSTCK